MQKILSVYWAFSPIYYVIRIFGLAPYSIVTKNHRASWLVSRFSLLYGIFFLIVVLLCWLPLIQHIKTTVSLGKLDKLAMYSDIFRRVSGILIATLCVTLSLVNRHRTCKLMKNMDDLDLDLMSFGIKVDYEKMRKENGIMVVVVYSLLSVCVLVDLVVSRILGEKSIQFWFASILLFVVSYTTVVQFVGFVLVLDKRFATLNKYFRNLNNQKENKKSKIWFTSQGNRQMERTEKNLKKEINPSIKFSGDLSSISVANATKYKMNPVSVVCDFHDRLCEWGKSLNSLHSNQMLYITGMSSVVVVIHLYIFYLMLSKNDKYDLTFFYAWKPAVWGLWFFSMIFLMSYVCTKTRDEANKISALLHQINFDLNDEESRKDIEIFSLQMLHQKLNFTAGGFFAMDFSSLRTMLVSVTTYLVFFIQFEMAARYNRTDKTPP